MKRIYVIRLPTMYIPMGVLNFHLAVCFFFHFYKLSMSHRIILNVISPQFYFKLSPIWTGKRIVPALTEKRLSELLRTEILIDWWTVSYSFRQPYKNIYFF